MMDYEKKYNEALERARELVGKWIGKNKDFYIEDYSYIFPELRESEDERIRKALVKQFGGCIKDDEFCHTGFTYAEITAWLEKQKEQKPAWSEEDERIIESLISLIETISEYYIIPSVETRNRYVAWLKSLRPQPKRDCKDCAMFLNGKCTKPNWKPSKEQMNSLDFAVTYLFSTKQNPTYLRDLYNDLKKLKED